MAPNESMPILAVPFHLSGIRLDLTMSLNSGQSVEGEEQSSGGGVLSGKYFFTLK